MTKHLSTNPRDTRTMYLKILYFNNYDNMTKKTTRKIIKIKYRISDFTRRLQARYVPPLNDSILKILIVFIQ